MGRFWSGWRQKSGFRSKTWVSRFHHRAAAKRKWSCKIPKVENLFDWIRMKFRFSNKAPVFPHWFQRNQQQQWRQFMTSLVKKTHSRSRARASFSSGSGSNSEGQSLYCSVYLGYNAAVLFVWRINSELNWYWRADEIDCYICWVQAMHSWYLVPQRLLYLCLELFMLVGFMMIERYINLWC